VFLLSHPHPRAYGSFARLPGHHVRDEHVLTLADAIHRLTLFPADVLSLNDRGALLGPAKPALPAPSVSRRYAPLATSPTRRTRGGGKPAAGAGR
jgi:hypothetical protein